MDGIQIGVWMTPDEDNPFFASIKFYFSQHPGFVTWLEDGSFPFFQENSGFRKTKITAEHTWGERDTVPDIHIVFA